MNGHYNNNNVDDEIGYCCCCFFVCIAVNFITVRFILRNFIKRDNAYFLIPEYVDCRKIMLRPSLSVYIVTSV